MVMTVLEAHVARDKWAALEKAYREGTQNLEPQVYQTFLIHGSVDTTLWRIITIWRSRAELEEIRRHGTPKGVLMFRAASVEPTLSVFDIVAQASATT